MPLQAGRLSLASRVLTRSVFVLALATACSSDGPQTVSPVVDPAALGTSSEVLNLANGPVVAQIKSNWNQSECVSVRNGTFAKNSATELDACSGDAAQSFQFVSTGEIKVGSNYCLDIYNGNSGSPGAAVVVLTCDGTGSQKWQQTSAGEIKGVGNGYCIGFKGHPYDETSLYIDNCRGTADQKWNTVASGQTSSSLPVASVTLSAEATTVRVKNSLQVTATLKDAAGSILSGRTISWASSNSGIATVSSSGLVTGVGTGSVTITATSEGKSGSLPISVTTVPVATVKVTMSPTSLAVNQTAQAQATLLDSAGNVLTGRSVIWSSSAATVASVTAAGLVTALAGGSANIVATSEGKTGSAAATVSASTSASSGGASCSLVTDWNARPTSAFAKPAYLTPTLEPDLGTTITRVGGDPGVAIPNIAGAVWKQLSKHNYSKDPVWSADQKLIVLKYMDGAVSGHLYLDGDTYQPLFTRMFVGSEQRWHPTIPDVMIYVTFSGGVGHWNVRANTTTTKFSIAGYSDAHMGPYEGNPSYDGKYVAVTATRVADGKLVAYVVDIDAGTKYPDIDLAAQGISNLDWVSVSASGNYVVALATVNGVLAGMKVWDKNGNPLRTWTDFRMAHLDMGYDQAGNEVIVGIPGSGTNGKRVIMRRLSDGLVTVLTPVISWNEHTSTRNYNRRGWAYMDIGDMNGTVLDQTVFAIKLDASGTVERLARHRSNIATNDYNSYPFPVPSPDGRRVMFASNWQTWGNGVLRPVQSFVIDTRQLCPNGLP